MNQTIENNVIYNDTDLELKKRILASNLSDEDKITIIERFGNSYVNYPWTYPSPKPMEVWYNIPPNKIEDWQITCNNAKTVR